MDLAIIPFALWCSFSLRLGEFFIPEGYRENTIYLFAIAPIIAIPIFIKFGLYRAIIRYMGIIAMWTIVKAVSLYTLIFGLFILLSGFTGVPRSVIIINWLMVVLLVGCTRALGRWWLRGTFASINSAAARTKVIIYGAGDAGVQIASALVSASTHQPVAFIDDQPSLLGRTIGMEYGARRARLTLGKGPSLRYRTTSSL